MEELQPQPERMQRLREIKIALKSLDTQRDHLLSELYTLIGMQSSTLPGRKSQAQDRATAQALKRLSLAR